MTRADSPTLWLASQSPRRAQLLREAGLEAHVQPPDLDDGQLRPGAVAPEWWVMSLAYLKARRAWDRLRGQGGVVLGADTVCAVDGEILGQPRDAGDAQRMLRLLRERPHRTLTGVCLLPLESSDRRLIAHDAAVVRVGGLGEDQIDAYIASEQWRGKAGAYNLAERIAAGWPIECEGDPTTVMGLPMRRLPGWLKRAAGAIDDC